MAGCNKQIVVYVERGYIHKPVTVRCGNTSPHGTPWLCQECERVHGHRNWRQEAIEAGETWAEDDY